ncbi:hemin uptake protein HemP [Cohaesibacter marisflavi]|nr:hemin uptake protein HemP [Cohaesibacter marisflavi]
MMPEQNKGPLAKPSAEEGQPALPLILDTERLFGNAREIHLSHRGEIYRLRITSQQKLILTK